MRRFADLHLCPSFEENFGNVRRFVEKAFKLGYRLVGISLPAHVSEEEVRNLRKFCQEVGVDLATRIDLKPRTRGELIQLLRRLRRKFEIICVSCLSKPVARQAAKDRRVDILSFPALDLRKRYFDEAEAELASNALASLEIDMAPLLSLRGVPRIRLISCLRKEVSIAEKFKVPIIISSGAKDIHLMRRPREYAALATLFDMESSRALVSLSETPLDIVNRNREKLSPNYVAPGIRIIKRGDC